MRVDKSALLLYAVTDRTWLNGRTLATCVEECLLGGVTTLQLREKSLDDATFLQEALEIKGFCRKYGVPFIINDDLDIALASEADGIHVGQSDLEASYAREKLGPNKIIGVSAQTVEHALKAEHAGADYLGVGAVFSTTTKSDADEVPYETLQAICRAVKIPVVAIGGINRHNIAELKGSGVDGIAVISALFAEKDITGAARVLLASAHELVTK